jgi:hypothetical protein
MSINNELIKAAKAKCEVAAIKHKTQPYIFVKAVPAENNMGIHFYPKPEMTWEQINEWFENAYPQHNWVWRGFGDLGTPNYVVVLVKSVCGMGQCRCVGEVDVFSKNKKKNECLLEKKGL